MKNLIFYLVVFLITSQNLFSQNNNNWTGTPDQKLGGLFTIWAQVKFGFPHRTRLDEINWDSTAQNFISKVIEANEVESYYKILMELTALLSDSHTEIIPPWGRFIPDYDIPQIEIVVINDRFYILRTGNTDEIKKQKIYPGIEILEVNDGIPVAKYFQDNVLKYHSRGSKQANNTALLYYMLYGPKQSKVKLKVRDLNGEIQNVELSRNANGGEGEPFFYTFIKHLFAKSIESRIQTDSILYITLPNFESKNKNIREDFLKMIDELDLAIIKGMIIDLRYNMGGSHSIMQPIVSCLIDEPVKAPTNHYFHYTAAYIPWQNKPAIEWDKREWEIQPRNGKRYDGPIVLLIGPYTHSSGEDMVIELSQRKNCITVGEPTAGGAGGKLSFPLPGGGEFNMSTFKATYPDGTEYMINGIQPDILIQRTTEDIVQDNDPVMDKAIELLSASKF